MINTVLILDHYWFNSSSVAFICLCAASCFSICLSEDVGDEGEEEKECISYNINIDIHYGLKSNR